VSLLLSQQSGLKVASAAFVGIGTLVAKAVRVIVASAVLVGAGALSATPVRIRAATAAFAGGGTVSATPAIKRSASAALAGRGTLTAIPVKIVKDSGSGGRRRHTLAAPVVQLPLPVVRAQLLVFNPARVVLQDQLRIAVVANSAMAGSTVLVAEPVWRLVFAGTAAPPIVRVTARAQFVPAMTLDEVLRLGLLDLILDA
jgi:acetyl-CoA carboxylase beta subunit